MPSWYLWGFERRMGPGPASGPPPAPDEAGAGAAPFNSVWNATAPQIAVIAFGDTNTDEQLIWNNWLFGT